MRRRRAAVIALLGAGLSCYVLAPRAGGAGPAAAAAPSGRGAATPAPDQAAAANSDRAGSPAATPHLAGAPYARPVEVAAAGWVRVPLDLAALRHLGLESSLRINGPAGEEVQHWTAPFIADSERRTVKVLEVKEDPRGWTLRLDVGPEPLTHERLLLDFSRLVGAPAVALDASADGQTWEPLVAGDLFRAGRSPLAGAPSRPPADLPSPAGDTAATAGAPQADPPLPAAGAPATAGTPGRPLPPDRLDTDEAAARASLLYPATTARYLRLSWPRGAGFPELRGALVEPTTPGRSLTVTSPNNPCQNGPAGATLICRLPLPAAGQTVRRLTVEMAGGQVIGYRLFAPRQARWEQLAAGVWHGAGARHVVPLGGGPLRADSLRLDLFGALADPRPRLLSHSFDLAVETVLFYAETGGRYVLSYGGAPAGEGSAAPPEGRSVAAGVDAAWVVPGAEEEGRLGPLPAAAAPGAKLPAERFRASWVVMASAAAGDLVRLPLPDVVYPQARPDLGDLRLVAGQSQIPYVRWAPPAPVPVLDRPDQRPDAEKGRRYSRIEVPLPAAGLPVTEIDLTTPPSPLRRPVGVRYPDPGPPALAAREERLMARASWECLPEPPLPCRLSLPLSGPAPRHLTVRFADGDNPPLASVDVSAWRRGDMLLFVWPGRERVRLLAGAPDLAPPVYDLAALSDVLPARPWQPAALDLNGDQRQGEAPWWSRWVLPVTLAIAGLFLLLLLRRILVEV
jgi:hypothetical protein